MIFHPDVMGVSTLAQKIRKIPNWPEAGILFHDITPVLQSPEYFRLLVDLFTYRYMGQKIDVVAGLDARGFIIGAALAYQLNVGFVPIRKKGKLPFETVSQSYALEYGEATVEMHTDALTAGSRVLLVDDIIDSGDSMVEIKRVLLEKFPQIELKTAVIFYKPKALIQPDFKISKTDEWINFFWENYTIEE